MIICLQSLSLQTGSWPHSSSFPPARPGQHGRPPPHSPVSVALMMNSEWGRAATPATKFTDQAEKQKFQESIGIHISPIVHRGDQMETPSTAFYDRNYKILYKSTFEKVIIRFIPISDQYFPPVTAANITLRESSGKLKTICGFGFL